MKVTNVGCIGPEGLEVALDEILCLVGPNNTGKTTILRAYELAAGKAVFTEHDLCKRAADGLASVELWVHIPKGTPNIAEKWKTTEDDLLLVRSRWEWSREAGLKRVRSTWDPETSGWSTETKAAGLDEVFESRLPLPLRIGTLQDPEEEHKALLTLVLQPIADRLKALQQDTASELKQALDAFIACAQKPVEEERSKIASLKDELNQSQTKIFPNLSVDLDVALGQIEMDLTAQLRNNSGVRFTEWADEVRWNQQGTGSQRALFWALLQVRSKLQTVTNLKAGAEKEIADLRKKKAKLEKDAAGVKKEETKAAKRAEIEGIQKDIEKRQKASTEPLLSSQSPGLTLPGYMLLIDEPEVGLHPAAIRAASRYLYALADDPAWQVILTTHAPSFIDPLQDHTTIIRLSRTQANPTPNTYRSEEGTFSKDEKESLKILNRFDTSLAEMFFGQNPILIEGDTEFAAFEWIMSQDQNAFPTSAKPILVRARGKHTLALVIRMLKHFKVSFSVLHDADTPYRRDGAANAAWQANAAILQEIESARSSAVRVVHRISIPTFELDHLPTTSDEAGHAKFTSGKDKPWNMVSALRNDDGAKESVRRVLDELVSANALQPPFKGDVLAQLEKAVTSWAQEHSAGDPRFFVSGK
jgi:ABC-type branched-subunit amino acid transport system ATPase component